MMKVPIRKSRKPQSLIYDSVYIIHVNINYFLKETCIFISTGSLIITNFFWFLFVWGLEREYGHKDFAFESDPGWSNILWYIASIIMALPTFGILISHVHSINCIILIAGLRAAISPSCGKSSQSALASSDLQAWLACDLKGCKSCSIKF